jgi:hypothetical protein
MTAYMTSAVWFPTAERLFSSPRYPAWFLLHWLLKALCHGNVEWLGADLTLAEIFVSDNFIFCANVSHLTLSCAQF